MKMKTILVINKDPAMRENTTEILELSGYNVLSEENLDSGLGIARYKKPDMIIFDDHMHKTKGTDFLRKLRLTDGLEPIPFILLTDSGDKKNNFSGINISPDELLYKPFDAEELLDLVARCLMQPDKKDGRFENQA
jgi:DNA-binding response OmpR family regulator